MSTYKLFSGWQVSHFNIYVFLNVVRIWSTDSPFYPRILQPFLIYSRFWLSVEYKTFYSRVFSLIIRRICIFKSKKALKQLFLVNRGFGILGNISGCNTRDENNEGNLYHSIVLYMLIYIIGIKKYSQTLEFWICCWQVVVVQRWLWLYN